MATTSTARTIQKTSRDIPSNFGAGRLLLFFIFGDIRWHGYTSLVRKNIFITKMDYSTNML